MWGHPFMSEWLLLHVIMLIWFHGLLTCHTKNNSYAYFYSILVLFGDLNSEYCSVQMHLWNFFLS